MDRINMDFLPMVNRNHAIKRAEKITRETKRKNIKATIVCITTLAIMFLFLLYSKANEDYTYAIASENNPGFAYEYVTDKVCTVTEINGELITVETHNGNLYEFYGDGYELNDRVVCTFNSADELIATK